VLSRDWAIVASPIHRRERNALSHR
jgi:hypothetical protein